MTTASTLRIAWRNLGRNWKRTVLALAAIGMGQFAFLATTALMHGYAEQFFNSVTGPLVGHVQVHEPKWRDDRSIDLAIEDLEAVLGGIREDPQVDHAGARIFAPVLVALTEDGFMGMVVGADAASEAHPSGILAGLELSDKLGDRRVLVGRSFARKYDIEPGMEIALIGQDVDGSIANDLYQVSDVISSAVELVNNLGIVMSLADAQDFLLLTDQAHEIVIHVKEPDLLDKTVSRISSLPALAGLEVLSWRKIAPQIVSMIEMMGAYRYIILFIVFIAAAAGIANTMLMSTYERTHEFGMLLSLGCRPARLARIVATEAIVLGQLGVILGSALGIGLVLGTSGSGIDYAALGGGESSMEMAFKGIQLSSRVFLELHPSDVIAGVVAMLLISFLAMIWPLLRIVRLEPMEALRS